MRFKTGLVVGAALGYYFGSKAGRERFEQIDARLDKVRSRPGYQKARDQVTGTLDTARTVVQERTGQVAGTAADKVDEAVEGLRPEAEETTSAPTSSSSSTSSSS